MSTERPSRPAEESTGASHPADGEGAGRRRGGRFARAPRRRDGGEDQKKSSLLRELPVLLLVAFVLALLVKTFLVQAFFIPSGSMETTLHGCTGCTGDRVLVTKPPYWFSDPAPGDIVVFRGPDTWAPEVSVAEPTNWFSSAALFLGRAIGVAPPSEDDYVKRVIATGGQTVQCCDDQGRILVDGQPLDEPYIYENTPLETRAFGPVTVPEGRLWVMGDHRSASADSRAHVSDVYSGTIAVSDVIGKASVIVWPFDRFTLLDSPNIQQQAAGAAEVGAVQYDAVVLAPLLIGLAGTGPGMAARRRRSRRPGAPPRTSRAPGPVASGPSRRPPGTGWRRLRPAPRTRPGRNRED